MPDTNDCRAASASAVPVGPGDAPGHLECPAQRPEDDVVDRRRHGVVPDQGGHELLVLEVQRRSEHGHAETPSDLQVAGV